MGCDIHVFLEKKTDEKYDCWDQVQLYKVDNYSHNLEIADAYSGRNYELFSVLAGVRGWYEPMIEPRGYPNNLSRPVEKEKEWYGIDAHTPTWYDLFELNLLIKDFKNEHENEDYIYEALDNFWNSLINYLDFAGEYVWEFKPNQYRVIIFFDS